MPAFSFLCIVSNVCFLAVEGLQFPIHEKKGAFYLGHPVTLIVRRPAILVS